MCGCLRIDYELQGLIYEKEKNNYPLIYWMNHENNLVIRIRRIFSFTIMFRTLLLQQGRPSFPAMNRADCVRQIAQLHMHFLNCKT